MEDDLNILGILKMTLIFNTNGRQPQHFRQMEDNLIFFRKMEDDLNISGKMEDDLNFILNQKLSKLFGNGSQNQFSII